jgi:type II secretory pathway component HofQ
VRAVLLVAMLASPAVADDLCKGTKHGAPIELDVKDADVQDVLRLIADVGDINLVVSDDVRGKVTLKLNKISWQSAACALAKLEHLALSFDQGVLLVTKR